VVNAEEFLMLGIAAFTLLLPGNLFLRRSGSDDERRAYGANGLNLPS
jgi:hypothetical protein